APAVAQDDRRQRLALAALRREQLRGQAGALADDGRLAEGDVPGGRVGGGLLLGAGERAAGQQQQGGADPAAGRSHECSPYGCCGTAPWWSVAEFLPAVGNPQEEKPTRGPRVATRSPPHAPAAAGPAAPASSRPGPPSATPRQSSSPSPACPHLRRSPGRD